MTRRLIPLAALSAAAALVLAACASGGGTTGDDVSSVSDTGSSTSSADAGSTGESAGSSSADDSSEPVTIVFQNQFSDAESAEMEKLVSQYQEAHGNVTVKLVRDNDSSYYDKLVTQITAGSGPDIVRLEPPKVSQYLANGWLEPVDDVITDQTKGDYFPNTIDAASKDGKIYGVPQDVSTLALFYRKDLFQQAGIDAPPATWDELTADAKKLTGDGSYGIGLFGGWGAYEFYPWLWQSGAEVLNDDGTQAVFNSDDGVRAVQLWVDLQASSMPPGMANATEDDVRGPFENGKLAMFTSGPYMVSTLKADKVPGDAWGIAPLPADKTSASVLGGMDLAVLANSKVKPAAKAFLTWLMGDDVQTTWAKDLGYIPVKQSMYDLPDFASDPTVTIFKDIVANSKSRPTIARAADVDSALGNAVQAALSGASTAKQALDDAAEKSDAAIKGNG